MRFAYAPHSPTLAASLLTWIDTMRRNGTQPFALLDGSMFRARDIERWRSQLPTLQIALADTRYEGYGWQGPLLLALDSVDADTLSTLLRRANGLPGLSFLAADPDPKKLCGALAWLADVHTEDGQNLHFRLADMRSLPVLLGILTPAQRTPLAKDIREWAWIARDGHLQTQRLERGDASLDASEPFSLDATQFSNLITRAEPDMVFQMFVDKLPHGLPDEPPHTIHARLARMLDAARSRGIVDLPDLFDYAIVGFSTHDDFDRHPAIQDTWRRIKSEGKRFGELIKQWPEETWQAL